MHPMTIQHTVAQPGRVQYSTAMNARQRQFVGVSLTPEARDALSRAALELTTPAGKRLSMSDMAIAAVRVARRHEAELIADLTGKPASGTAPPREQP